MGLARYYKRWRHGRGFGIHSPFAYSFTLETLRQRLPYYAYDELDALRTADPTCRLKASRLRLIFRIVLRLRPTSVAIIAGDSAPMLRHVIRLACPAAETTDRITATTDFVLIADNALPTDTLPECNYIVIGQNNFRQSVIGPLWSAVPHHSNDAQHAHGMLFDNARDMTILVADSRLPHQSFDLRF